jgi:hypothetical protein
MASHSLPVPVPQARERSQLHVANRLPSLRVAVAVFAALLILFAWLHLLVAMQIASTNRLIMQRTAELDRLERDKQAILLKIAQSESPIVMVQRLLEEGFVRQELMYLDVSQTATQPMTSESEQPVPIAAATDREETVPGEPPSLLETIISSLKPEP